MQTEYNSTYEEERSEQRAKQRARMREEKKKQELLRKKIKKYGVYSLAGVCALIIAVVSISFFGRKKEPTPVEPPEVISESIPVDTASVETQETVEEPSGLKGLGELTTAPVAFFEGYKAVSTDSTRTIRDEDVQSEYAVLVNADSGEVVINQNMNARINPASMTKILTILIAAEHVSDLDDTVEITTADTDYAYVNDCMITGFTAGEKVTVRDLFYGTILPSGADAASALAVYTAGSLEEFVQMMNDKLSELGLSETTHFTNCVGIYDENHYSTVYDMAMIMKAVMENDWCREVMNAHTYTTSVTAEHPEGIKISNWFLRRIEDKDTGGEVIAAKTGYVVQSGNCGASYYLSEEGKPYLCVTAKAHSSWRCIYDHVDLYKKDT